MKPDVYDIIQHEWTYAAQKSLSDSQIQFGLRPIELGDFPRFFRSKVFALRGPLIGRNNPIVLPFPLRRPHWGYRSPLKVLECLTETSNQRRIVIGTDFSTNIESIETLSNVFRNNIEIESLEILKIEGRIAQLHSIASQMKLLKLDGVIGIKSSASVGSLMDLAANIWLLLGGDFSLSPNTEYGVVCGVREAPLVEIAVRVSRALRGNSPTYFFSNSLRGIRGQDRMAGGIPSSTVFWDDKPDTVRSKIRTSVTTSLPPNSGVMRAKDCHLLRVLRGVLSEHQWNQVVDGCISGSKCAECKVFAASLTCS